LTLNRVADLVEVRPEAMASHSGTSVFFDEASPASNANSLVPDGRSNLAIEVQTTTLDDFVLARGLHVNALKVDVEGAELEVLRGGAKTFDACRPSLALSLHPSAIKRAQGSLEDIWRVLESYRMIILHDNKTLEQSWFCRQVDLFDVVALPAE
jgi:FkbM family methyltransferase